MKSHQQCHFGRGGNRSLSRRPSDFQKMDSISRGAACWNLTVAPASLFYPVTSPHRRCSAVSKKPNRERGQLGETNYCSSLHYITFQDHEITQDRTNLMQGFVHPPLRRILGAALPILHLSPFFREQHERPRRLAYRQPHGVRLPQAQLSSINSHD